MINLSKAEEDVLQTILDHYVKNDKNSLLITNNDFPQYASCNLRQYLEFLKNRSLIASFNQTNEDIEIYLTPDGINYFENKKKQAIPKNSMDLLYQLLNQDNPVEYMQSLFKDLDHKADSRLRAMMGYLKEEGYIETLWADDVPDHIEFNEKAYLLEYGGDIKNTFNISDFGDRMGGIRENTVPKYQAKGIPQYDVFISHANRDKEDFVEELYQAINKLGINIFYDKDVIDWGDNWKNVILDGTKKSEFAVIVISENFFDREWTEKELAEFLSRQNRNGQKLILPILHNITLAQLQKRYPSVADIQAIDSKKYTCDQIAIMFARQLIKRLKNI